MRDEADDHHPNETGGILLGYWAREGEAVVTSVVGPGPRATHGPYGFGPDNEYQERELAVAYAESDGRIAYLGDWHTHPGSVAEPSGKDRGTIRRIAREPEARCPEPLMVILGQRERWQFAAWQGRIGFLGILRVRPAGLTLYRSNAG